jgi:hypothetical protein
VLHLIPHRVAEDAKRYDEAWLAAVAALAICDEDEWLHLHALKLAALAKIEDADDN